MARTEVLGRVLILRVVAAPDVATGGTQAEVHPGIADEQAFLTACTVRRIGQDELQVIALLGHVHVDELMSSTI